MGMEFPADELREILEMAKETAEIATRLTAEALELQLAKDTPKGKTNELSSGWERDGGGLEYRIFNPVEYALSVHDGSRPHKIEAKHKEALNVPGYGIFKSVWHPGYRGYPWTVNSMLAIELRLEEFAQMALQQTGAMG